MPKHPLKPLIRKISQAEHSEVLHLVGAFPKAAGFSWPPEKLLQELREAEAWGLTVENQLAGFVAFRENADAFEITVLGTAVGTRRAGVMKTLLMELINAHSHKDWWLEVHEENQAALKLYQSLGFEITGRRSKYYPDGKTALLMTLKKNS